MAISKPVQTRVNERIRVREVRLIDDEGNQVGVIATRDALEMARERGLDLVEVAPNASPPTCTTGCCDITATIATSWRYFASICLQIAVPHPGATPDHEPH